MYRKYGGFMRGTYYEHNMNIIWTWGEIYLKVFYTDFYILPRDYRERKYKRLYSLYRTLYDI